MQPSDRRALYFEDFAPGQKFASGRVRITAEEIKRFAAEFDPQPFHLDEAAAGKTFFGGLVASGWHTAALTMRLWVQSDLAVVGGLIGAGVEAVRWPRPVRPGDELHLISEILESRELRSRPEYGIVKVQAVTFNQRDEPVQESVANLLVPKRAGAASGAG